MMDVIDSVSPSAQPLGQTPLQTLSVRRRRRLQQEHSQSLQRDTNTRTGTATSMFAPISRRAAPWTTRAQRSAAVLSGRASASSSTPSTAAIRCLLLVSAAGIGTALAGPAGECSAQSQRQAVRHAEADPCLASPARLALRDWTKYPLRIGHHGVQEHIFLGLLALLSLLGLAHVFLKRFTSPRNRPAKRPWLISAMALFTFASLLVLTALHLHTASGQSQQPTVAWSPAQTGPTTNQAPVFTLPASADVGKNILPNIKDPQAVDPQTVCPGYKASNVRNVSNAIGSAWKADLDLAGRPCNVYGNDIEHLTLSIDYHFDDRVHVEIRPRYIGPANESWFLLPTQLVPRDNESSMGKHRGPELEVSWSNDPTFSFTVKRKSTGDTLFSTEGKVLVYEDQFIEFASPLPENYNLYGLGEVIHGFRLGNNLTRTLFAADVGDVVDANIYGSHPIYLDTRYFTSDSDDDNSGKLTYVANATDTSATYVSYTHGVYLRNAHAQEVLLRPCGITWRALGGTVDLYFYSGPQATDVMRTYHETMTGFPAMQQYWTLGLHQCRWGYNSWAELQEVVDNFANADLPLETIWTDIDYMKQYRNFENDPERFGYEEGARFLARLRANHQHYVPIVDSAIYAPNPADPADAYLPYDRGVDADAFVMNPDGSIYYGAVWPGYTVFPDWVGAVLNGSGAIDWWINELSMWAEKIAFDGLWIDMSEVASFCVGSCGTGNLTLNPAHPPFNLPGEPGNLVLGYPEGFERTNMSEAYSALSSLGEQEATQTTAPSPTSFHRSTPTPGARNVDWPPYAVNNFHGDLAVHAISPNATHHGGYLEYDFHNLFGHQILNATYQALLTIHEGKRPFIIGRSTFAGSGRWAGHWGGDNEARWAHMYLSIPQALSFSLFGVSMFGADACGFAGNTDLELCARWMQLAAFFPFYRNHNTRGAIPQEPYAWEAVADATRSAARTRYALLPYLYTLMWRASAEGRPVMRALAWEFPAEPWLADADRQFLLGDALMVVPCLEQGAVTVGAVFPGVGQGTVWYDWYTRAAVTEGVGPGENVTIDAPLGHIPLFVRGGSVVPVQEPGMTTAESRRNPWGLVVALDGHQVAEGWLHLDDGESLRSMARGQVRFTATARSLSAKRLLHSTYVDNNSLGNATIMGLAKRPVRIWLNNRALDSRYWTYDQDTAVLLLRGLNRLFAQGAWTESWEFKWE